MRLYIIRHGETLWNKKDLIQGHADTDLSGIGKQQAKKLAERLVKHNIDKIYCSDLKRCKQTISPFLKLKKDIPVKYVKELRERNFGEFEGKPSEKMREWIRKEGNNDYYTKIPQGESFMDVRNRLSKFFKKLFKKEKGKNVLLVMHGGSKRALITNLLKRDLKKSNKKFKIPNTALSIINIKDDGNHRARLMNSIRHLEK